MNEVLKCLKERRSIRKYRPEQIKDSELEQILVQMRRKVAGKLPLSYEEKMKLMGSFYRKGFQSDSIKKALDIVVSECEHD